MEKINQQIEQIAVKVTAMFQTQTKRTIALVLTVLTTVLGVFGGFISLNSDIREGLSYIMPYVPSSIANVVKGGSYSLVDLANIAFKLDAVTDGLVIVAFVGAFVALGALAVTGVLGGKKGKTFPLAIFSIVAMIVAMVTVGIYNNELKSSFGMFGLDSSFLVINMQIVITAVLGCFAHLFWVSAHAEMSQDGSLEKLGSAKEEFSVIFNKAKEDATKAAEIAKVKAQKAKEDNSCKSCGKLISPTAKFCASCGAKKEDPKPADLVIEPTEVNQTSTEE